MIDREITRLEKIYEEHGKRVQDAMDTYNKAVSKQKEIYLARLQSMAEVSGRSCSAPQGLPGSPRSC